MDIAAIGARHLADALAGKMKDMDVEAWKDDEGKPARIYWKPLTGVQQVLIDECETQVAKTCMTLKIRALNEEGKQIFKDTALVSLTRDYDYLIVKSIVYFMFARDGIQDIEDRQKLMEKE